MEEPPVSKSEMWNRVRWRFESVCHFQTSRTDECLLIFHDVSIGLDWVAVHTLPLTGRCDLTVYPTTIPQWCAVFCINRIVFSVLPRASWPTTWVPSRSDAPQSFHHVLILFRHLISGCLFIAFNKLNTYENILHWQVRIRGRFE